MAILIFGKDISRLEMSPKNEYIVKLAMIPPYIFGLTLGSLGYLTKSFLTKY